MRVLRVPHIHLPFISLCWPSKGHHPQGSGDLSPHTVNNCQSSLWPIRSSCGKAMTITTLSIMTWDSTLPICDVILLKLLLLRWRHKGPTFPSAKIYLESSLRDNSSNTLWRSPGDTAIPVSLPPGTYSFRYSKLQKSLFWFLWFEILRSNERIWNIWPCGMVVSRSRAGHWLA